MFVLAKPKVARQAADRAQVAHRAGRAGAKQRRPCPACMAFAVMPNVSVFRIGMRALLVRLAEIARRPEPKSGNRQRDGRCQH